jgi:hypothetical protein
MIAPSRLAEDVTTNRESFCTGATNKNRSVEPVTPVNGTVGATE